MNKKISKMYQRDSFINALYKYAKNDKKIILISNDQGAIALDNFRSKIPSQFINAGISEQNIIGVAAGLQKEGFNCFIYSIASFIINRAIEQIKIDLCSMQIPVKIFGVGSGYSYAVDGPSHHAIDDIGLLNSMPKLEIFSPSSSLLVKDIVAHSIKTKYPTYVRLDREFYNPKINFITKKNFKDGFFEIKKGKNYCLVTTGNILENCLVASGKFSKLNIGIIDLFKIKPIQEKFLNTISRYKKVFIIEEHYDNSGIGSIISNKILEKKLNVEIIKIGLKENFLYGYGSRKFLQANNCIDSDAIIKTIKKKI